MKEEKRRKNDNDDVGLLEGKSKNDIAGSDIVADHFKINDGYYGNDIMELMPTMTNLKKWTKLFTADTASPGWIEWFGRHL